MEIRPLEPHELRWTCPAEALDFKTTEDLKPSGRIVGQDRAINALKLGLEIPSIGYNIFVTGVSGTGRETTVKMILDSVDTTTDDLRDIMYVGNMEDPHSPVVLTFPAGGGRRFAQALEECVQLLRSNIPAVLESEKAEEEVRSIRSTYETRKKEMMEKVREKAEKEGLALVNIPVSPNEFRPDVLPVMDDEPVTFDALRKLVEEGKLTEKDYEEFSRKHDEIFRELTQVFRKTRDLEIERNIRLMKMLRRLLRPTITGIISILKEIGNEKADAWADSLVEMILDNLEDFTGSDENGDPYAMFVPNLIVDNSGVTRRPVVIEKFPDSISLFGNIDRIVVDGKPYSDHTMIRPGAIHRADGGYLIMNALDLVRDPALWQRLIQTLRNRTTVIRSHDPMGLYPVNLHPEPLDTNVKVILIGSSSLYGFLASMEPEFGLLFRVRAAFDFTMEATQENIAAFADVIAGIIASEGLLPMTSDAVAAIVEESARMTGIHDRISLEFNRVTDYLRQSAYFARIANDPVVTVKHVKEAVRQKMLRLNMGEQYALRQILDGTVKIDTRGAKVGQVNGLAVYQGVDYAFGLPVKLTTRVSAGRKGIINVERESHMSGMTHTKGMLIIAGFMQGKFAREYPLSLSASVVFEQSYGGIEGDSASSTELYVLFSALSELPIRQDIAVTGSVNQFGEIQAIGGVNEKIEGFFRVCMGRGLTGTQGVMIPSANVKDLHLRDEVIKAVEDGKFHVWPVDTIEDGAELLMGMKAGELMPDGMYPADTIYGKVDRRLRYMAETLRDFAYHD